MRIGLDFDGTITADPGLWRGLVLQAMTRGHAVVIVTARRPTSENKADIEAYLQEHEYPKVPVVYTSLGSKTDFMKKRETPVDIWIEDDPLTCALGH